MLLDMTAKQQRMKPNNIERVGYAMLDSLGMADVHGALVTSVEAVSELVPPPETVTSETLTIRVGETHAPDRWGSRCCSGGWPFPVPRSVPGPTRGPDPSALLCRARRSIPGRPELPRRRHVIRA